MSSKTSFGPDFFQPPNLSKPIFMSGVPPPISILELYPVSKLQFQLAWPQLETKLGQNSAWAKATLEFIFMYVFQGKHTLP